MRPCIHLHQKKLINYLVLRRNAPIQELGNWLHVTQMIVHMALDLAFNAISCSKSSTRLDHKQKGSATTYNEANAIGSDLVALLHCKCQVASPGEEDDDRTLHAAGLKIDMCKRHLLLLVGQVEGRVMCQGSRIVAMCGQLDGSYCFMTNYKLFQEDPIDLGCKISLLQDPNGRRFVSSIRSFQKEAKNNKTLEILKFWILPAEL